MSSTGGDSTMESRLDHLRRSRQRRSMGRVSVGSAASQKSFQNVTESLKVSRINQEISDTENSIKALEREINQVKERRESRSVYADTEDDFFNEDYFMRHSRPRTHKPFFSLLFAALCIVMFFAEVGVNDWTIEDVDINPLIGPSVDTLIELGAKKTELLQDGQVYRLVTPIVLHVGLIHLFVNLLGLFVIGVPLEQEFGTWRITIIALFSGIAGVVLSALLAPNVIGVGASGAIFGLVGAAWADLFHNWHTYRGKNMHMLLQYTICTILNFFFGLMPFVDNFAHLGGFLVGLTTGTVLLIKQYGEAKQNKSVQICMRVLAVLVLPIVMGVLLFLLFIGVDVATNCSGCEKISCVPFPPGADKDDRWWDCSKCFNGFGDFDNFTEGGPVDIKCPNGTTIVGNSKPGQTEAEFEKAFPSICSLVCE